MDTQRGGQSDTTINMQCGQTDRQIHAPASFPLFFLDDLAPGRGQIGSRASVDVLTQKSRETVVIL